VVKHKFQSVGKRYTPSWSVLALLGFECVFLADFFNNGCKYSQYPIYPCLKFNIRKFINHIIAHPETEKNIEKDLFIFK